MGSFISRFKGSGFGGVSSLPVVLLMVALASLASSAIYVIYLSPEISFLKDMSSRQKAWASRKRGERMFIIGGSSAMFSVVPEEVSDSTGPSIVNFGLNAGLGPVVLTERVLPELRRGDTLILALESGMLSDSLQPTSLGVQYSFAMGNARWVLNPRLDGGRIGIISAILALRPGAAQVFGMIGKMCLRRPLYRYSVDSAGISGWNQTQERRPLQEIVDKNCVLSGDARRWLEALHRWCCEHEVKLFYSTPWCWVPEPEIKNTRRLFAQYILGISEYMPVLRDEGFGVSSDESYFADTVWHLNAQGKRKRTHQLERDLVDLRVWEPVDLNSFVSQPAGENNGPTSTDSPKDTR